MMLNALSMNSYGFVTMADKVNIFKRCRLIFVKLSSIILYFTKRKKLKTVEAFPSLAVSVCLDPLRCLGHPVTSTCLHTWPSATPKATLGRVNEGAGERERVPECEWMSERLNELN